MVEADESRKRHANDVLLAQSQLAKATAGKKIARNEKSDLKKRGDRYFAKWNSPFPKIMAEFQTDLEDPLQLYRNLRFDLNYLKNKQS